ncbi:MAG: hypothetical protein ACLPKH_18770 [Rhodomicrobium sp.]
MQAVIAARRLEPKGQPRDLDRLGVEIDAVKIFRYELGIEAGFDVFDEIVTKNLYGVTFDTTAVRLCGSAAPSGRGRLEC